MNFKVNDVVKCVEPDYHYGEEGVITGFNDTNTGDNLDAAYVRFFDEFTGNIFTKNLELIERKRYVEPPKPAIPTGTMWQHPDLPDLYQIIVWTGERCVGIDGRFSKSLHFNTALDHKNDPEYYDKNWERITNKDVR